MLKLEHSCEIGDLIHEVVKISGKSHNEVRDAMFEAGIYPESNKTYLTDKFGPIVDDCEWLDEVLNKIFLSACIDSLYVTNEI